MSSYKNVRIGEVLKEYGYITEDQLQEALDFQHENRGQRLGNIMQDKGFISESQLLDALARKLGLEHIAVSSIRINTEVVSKIPQHLAEQYNILCVRVDEETGRLNILTNDPLNFYGLEDVRQLTGMDLQILLVETAPLQEAIKYYYSEVTAKKAAKTANVAMTPQVEEIEVEEGDGDTPIINLLDSLIQRAYSTNASDIHIEPFEKQTLVRMRIDGVIVDYVTLQKALHASLIARIKIISDLDIAERRIPQDGHFRMRVEDEMVNLRVSVIPTVFGEKAVLRLLSSNGAIDHGHTFGMNEESFDKFSRMLKAPYGILYITGPTGSGKSTTLYMVLDELAKKQTNISTIEDPVEKNLPRVNQMQVNNQAGLTFEIGLRALLRQDPDVIMVGETRDAETASISIRAAITGHLVLSTLHTNNAAATIVRLVDMGMEPYMIASSLMGVVAQRLMRKVCPYCSTQEEPTAEEKLLVGEHVKIVRHAKGCNRCNFTGYSGRVAIHEILMMDDEVRKLVSDRASTEDIVEYAINQQHMKTLRQSGVELVEQGITTPEELRKIAYFS